MQAGGVLTQINSNSQLSFAVTLVLHTYLPIHVYTAKRKYEIPGLGLQWNYLLFQ